MKNIVILPIILALLTGFTLSWTKKTTIKEATPNILLETTTMESDIDGNPEELGNVHWIRDLDAGHKESIKTGKPLLILFQEVPGCSNCTRYGNNTLRHPLIVEAIETFFIPVCIYNNKGGKDADALKLFEEPTWNNPVVRIVRSDNSDITPRIPDFRSSVPLVSGIRQALSLISIAPPRYLDLLDEELTARATGLETATFSMYCFWSGEGTFGSIPGVIETTSGFQGGKEVVKVQFDPRKTSKTALEEQTQPKGIETCSKNDGFKTDREPKYYLSKSPYKFIPMTSLQSCLANSMVGRNESPDALLSPRQLAMLQTIKAQPTKKWEDMIGVDMVGISF